MWKHLVVFLDVERDESPDHRHAVQRVEKEPLVFERAPPRSIMEFEKFSPRERQDAAQNFHSDKVVDPRIHVLDTRVRQDGRNRLRRRYGPTGLDKDSHAVHRRKRVRDPPRQDPSREVVDHRVQVSAGAVEQADDGRVDLPRLVGSRGSKAIGFTRCMRSRGRRQPKFCRDGTRSTGRPDLAEPLHKDSERAGRDMPVLGRSHHVPDCPDLG